MRIRRDWFNTIATFLFEIIILFAIMAGIGRLGEGREYSWLLRGKWIGAVALILLVFSVLSSLYNRLEISKKISKFSKLLSAAEILSAALILAAALMVRLNYLKSYPVELDGEYKSYFDIAELIHSKQLDFFPYYRDFIAMFPFHYGFPHLLSILFSFTGVSLHSAVSLNLALQIGALILVWQIARRLGGSLAGLISLAVFSFLPSNVVYSSFFAEEFEFVFLLLLGILLLLIQNQHKRSSRKKPFLEAVLLAVSGIIFGIATWVQPFVPVILAAFLLYVRTGTSWMPSKPKNDISLGLRMTEKGWQRILILLIFYIAAFIIGQKGINYAVDEPVASIGTSLGYSFMTGMNVGEDGKWNQADSDYLYGVLNETGSAVEAQLACRSLGFERMTYSAKMVGNMMLKKLADVTGNDEFAVSLMATRLQGKGALTKQLEDSIGNAFTVSNFSYLIMLFFAGFAALLLYFRKPDFSLFFVFLCDGAFLMFLFLENQPRYHYFLLPIFAIMSGLAFSELHRLIDVFIMNRKKEQEKAKRREELRAKKIADLEAFELEIRQTRAEALHAQFDMGPAIRDGHIRIIASEAAGEQALQSGKAPVQEASNITLNELEKLADKQLDDENKQQTAPAAEGTEPHSEPTDRKED